MPDAKLLTTKEACHYLFGKFNRNTKTRMYRFLKSGVLGSIRFGDNGQHYWRTVDLDGLMASDPAETGTGYTETN